MSLPIIEESDRYTLVHTGAMLDCIERDLKNLSADTSMRFSVDPLVWDGPYGEKVYRPPGVWCRYRGDRAAAGCPLLWWFPEPYHPVEALAAMRGFGELKEQDGPLTPREWEHIQRVQRIRYQGWVPYTAELARALIVYPAQLRVLYHLLTPLRTNGCTFETEQLLHTMRNRLFEACGLPGRDIEWASRATRNPAGAPTRMQFWGIECAGRIEL